MADVSKQTPVGLALHVVKQMLAIVLKPWQKKSQASEPLESILTEGAELPLETVADATQGETSATISPQAVCDQTLVAVNGVESGRQPTLEPQHELERAAMQDEHLTALKTDGEINTDHVPEDSHLEVDGCGPEALGRHHADTSEPDVMTNQSNGIENPEGNPLEPEAAIAPENPEGSPLTDWQTLAWQGDQDAFQQGLNQALVAYQAQVAELNYKGDCLQISVEGAQVPNQADVVPVLRTILQDLNLSTVTRLEIYGQQIGLELPFWMAQFALDEPSWMSDADVIQLASDPQPLTEGEERAVQRSETLLADYAAGQRDFSQTEWGDVQLPGACLNLANFQESHLVWANLQGASLWQANLSGAKLRHADLSGANLQGARLNGSDLRSANLKGANLSWAQLQGANLTDADLTDANLSQAQLDHVIMPDGTHLD